MITFARGPLQGFSFSGKFCIRSARMIGVHQGPCGFRPFDFHPIKIENENQYSVRLPFI